LAKYLKKIAELDDFSNLNHKYWERSVLDIVTLILNMSDQYTKLHLNEKLDLFIAEELVRIISRE